MGDLKATVRALYAGTSAGGDLDATIDEFAADDFVEHEELPPGMDATGKDIPRQLFGMMRTAFADFAIEVHDLIAEGDKVAARVTFTGTHQGEFMGVPASGNAIEVPVFDIFGFRDGKVSEHWGAMDMGSLMMQIGALEGP